MTSFNPINNPLYSQLYDKVHSNDLKGLFNSKEAMKAIENCDDATLDMLSKEVFGHGHKREGKKVKFFTIVEHKELNTETLTGKRRIQAKPVQNLIQLFESYHQGTLIEVKKTPKNKAPDEKVLYRKSYRVMKEPQSGDKTETYKGFSEKKERGTISNTSEVQTELLEDVQKNQLPLKNSNKAQNKSDAIEEVSEKKKITEEEPQDLEIEVIKEVERYEIDENGNKKKIIETKSKTYTAEFEGYIGDDPNGELENLLFNALSSYLLILNQIRQQQQDLLQKDKEPKLEINPNWPNVSRSEFQRHKEHRHWDKGSLAVIPNAVKKHARRENVDAINAKKAEKSKEKRHEEKKLEEKKTRLKKIIGEEVKTTEITTHEKLAETLPPNDEKPPRPSRHRHHR